MTHRSRILIVAAHPDDEVLGCGGTIAAHAKAGHDVFVAILGEGITSRSTKKDGSDSNSIQELKSQSKKAAQLLGVRELSLNDLPDNRFDTVPFLDVVKLVEDPIERFAPDIIYTHNGSDLNIDHTVTNRAVLTATRPTEGSTVTDLYTFEVPSSTEWAFGQLSPSFTPNVFMDIDSTLATKLEAMALYESESRSFPHPRSPKALTALAQHWGSVAGVNAAEAFALVRKIQK